MRPIQHRTEQDPIGEGHVTPIAIWRGRVHRRFEFGGQLARGQIDLQATVARTHEDRVVAKAEIAARVPHAHIVMHSVQSARISGIG